MNHLAGESSPYLRQHVDNPVDWYPWGPQATALAKELDLPILLSIGYSACHWCHVMAHESFEDEAIATIMNERFVNVKVDREERPDIDAIYMSAVQALTGRGGWPMTVFLTPDGEPFFGGTYFPPEDRHGTPGFPRILDAVDGAWRDRRGEVAKQAVLLAGAVARSHEFPRGEGLAGTDVSSDLVDLAHAAESIHSNMDLRFGGFGGAPKFPQAPTLEFLLTQCARDGVGEITTALRQTLDAMADGGIYDQIGGGFHRYSVDAFWQVPHFEKMLYDQALLARTYLHAGLLFESDRYLQITTEIIEYVLGHLTDPSGGFYAAEDADSEGEEGRFYLWQTTEIEQLCGDVAGETIAYYGATIGGNYEGANIPHVSSSNLGRTSAVEKGRALLADARELRVRPGLDEKVLLGWNALFCKSLTEAASALDRPDWMETARANARFCLTNLARSDGRFLRSWISGEARHLAVSEDYAALLAALVTLAELDDVGWLTQARSVADELIALFGAPGGGFFTTGSDGESLMVRPRDFADHPVPSANSLATDALLRLASLSGDLRYREIALELFELFANIAAEHPGSVPAMLCAVDHESHGPVEIVIVGEPSDERTLQLWNVVRKRFIPGAITLRATTGTDDASSPLLLGRCGLDLAPTAYLCVGNVCELPTRDPEILGEQIDHVLRR